MLGSSTEICIARLAKSTQSVCTCISVFELNLFLTLYMVALPYGNKLPSCSFCNISRSNWAFYLKFSAKILQNKLLILSYFCRGCHKILLSYDEKFSKKKNCNFCVFELYSKRASFWYMEHRVKNEDFQKVYVKG